MELNKPANLIKSTMFFRNKDTAMNTCISDIDFSQLLDVRVDYLFKLIFGTDVPRLVSLLNAILQNG